MMFRVFVLMGVIDGCWISCWVRDMGLSVIIWEDKFFVVKS